MSDGLSAVLPEVYARQAQLDRRPRHYFEFPDKLKAEAGADGIALVALDLTEEFRAYERIKASNLSGPTAAHHLAMESLRCLWKNDASGKPVTVKELSHTDASLEAWYFELDPRLRQLCVIAYGDVHNNEPDDGAIFLKSRRVLSA